MSARQGTGEWAFTTSTRGFEQPSTCPHHRGLTGVWDRVTQVPSRTTRMP